MKPQILLIHGFNVWDGGQQTVGELRGYFAALGCPYHILDYGHFGLLDTRFKNDNVARRAARFINDAKQPVIVVSHSNGSAITYLAMSLYGANPAHCVFINPALDNRIALPSNCPTVDVWHSPSDAPVKLTNFLKVPAAFRPWGAMGSTGYLLDDPRVRNYNKETGFSVSSSAHSDVFQTEKLSYFGPLIAGLALARMTHDEKLVTATFGPLPV